MIKTIKGASLALLLSILFVTGARAQSTYTAASCNESDVQAAVTAEQASHVDGDIISIPSGTCTWTGSTGIHQYFANSVTIQGAGAESATTGGASVTGTDVTIITDNISSDADLFLQTTAGKSLRITGIALLQNSSSSGKNNAIWIGGYGSTSSSAVRIDHCHFYSTAGGSTITVTDAVLGVADHNYFNATSSLLHFAYEFTNGSMWNGDTSGLGHGAFADSSHWGTSEFFYVEDSYFYYGTYVTDCEDGGRFVVRYSTIVNATLNEHGTAGSPGRGCRAVEAYGNTISYPNDSNGYSDVAVGVNSGGAIVWGNTVSNNMYIVQSDDLRDGNGTYSEAAPPSGWGYCGSAQSGVTSSWDQNTSSSGYACLDQAGRGQGDLVTGSSFPSIANSVLGGQTWPREALDPLYVWDNTYNVANGGSIFHDATGGKVADNRDVYQQFGTYGEPGTFNGTAGIGQGTYSQITSTCTAGSSSNTTLYNSGAPGVGYWATDQNTLYVCTATNTWTAYYTPYTYPNPLTAASGAAPSPPTNVTAVAH